MSDKDKDKDYIQNLIKTFNENDAKIVEVKNNLQKTYGEVTIDLNDGSIKESVENDGK